MTNRAMPAITSTFVSDPVLARPLEEPEPAVSEPDPEPLSPCPNAADTPRSNELVATSETKTMQRRRVESTA